MRLEKVLSVFLAIVIMVITVPVTAVAAETEGYYTYTVSSGKATITDVDISISGAVVIPDKLGGYPVTRITETAFLGCSGITKITIPGSVTVIDSSAKQFERIIISGGRIGAQIILAPDDLAKAANAEFADILAE